MPPPRGAGSRAIGGRAIEDSLPDFDQPEIADDHADERDEEARRQRLKPESVSERGGREQCPHGNDPDGREGERQAWVATEEGDTARANREDDERLGGKRLNEPARPKLRGAGVKDAEHHREGRKVEDRTEWAEEDHEPANEPDVPMRWTTQLLLVDPVGRYRELARVVQHVVEQDL